MRRASRRALGEPERAGPGYQWSPVHPAAVHTCPGTAGGGGLSSAGGARRLVGADERGAGRGQPAVARAVDAGLLLTLLPRGVLAELRRAA